MESALVDLEIADGVSSRQLHDMWVQLFRRRSEAVKVSCGQWPAARITAASNGESGSGSRMYEG